MKSAGTGRAGGGQGVQVHRVQWRVYSRSVRRQCRGAGEREERAFVSFVSQVVRVRESTVDAPILTVACSGECVGV